MSIHNTRTLHIPISDAQFGLLIWASNRCRRKKAGGKIPPMSLAEFGERAVFELVQEIISEVAIHGGKIPAGVAKDYEGWKIRQTRP